VGGELGALGAFEGERVGKGAGEGGGDRSCGCDGKVRVGGWGVMGVGCWHNNCFSGNSRTKYTMERPRDQPPATQSCHLSHRSAPSCRVWSMLRLTAVVSRSLPAAPRRRLQSFLNIVSQDIGPRCCASVAAAYMLCHKAFPVLEPTYIETFLFDLFKPEFEI